MIWDSIKTGGDGSKSEDDLRYQHSGTVIAFLDKAMQAYSNFVPHSFHMQQSKTTDRECYENTVPDMIRDNTDWSENGECKVKHQIQSEYWSIVYYSLLITISSFLISSIWKDRTSALKKGDEVTVEPHDHSCQGHVDVVEGSFFVVVDQDSLEVVSDVTCTVRTTDGEVSLVKREYLRHRKWYRIVFLQGTNDKKHDCWSSQAFTSRRIEFYDIFHKNGLDEALKFASNDKAETARQEATLMAENSRCVATVTCDSGASIEGQAEATVVTALLREARAPGDEETRRKSCDVSAEEFERRHVLVQEEKFWT
jgi:hypothetical protein